MTSQRFSENNITAHYDKEASDLMQRAAENAKQSDNATSPEAKEKYWNVALAYFNQAINALGISKSAVHQSKKIDSLPKIRLPTTGEEK